MLGDSDNYDYVTIQMRCENFQDPMTYLYIFETLVSTYRDLKSSGASKSKIIEFKINLNFFAMYYSEEGTYKAGDFKNYIEQMRNPDITKLFDDGKIKMIL